MNELESALQQSRSLRERFCEDIGARLEANYDLLVDEPDEFTITFFKLAQTEIGASFLSAILGVKHLDEIVSDFQAEILLELEED